MAVNIIANENDSMAAFYCTTSGFAFGPVHSSTNWNAYIEMRLFHDTLLEDPRDYSDDELRKLYSEFIDILRECRCGCPTVADDGVCPECTEIRIEGFEEDLEELEQQYYE